MYFSVVEFMTIHCFVVSVFVNKIIWEEKKNIYFLHSQDITKFYSALESQHGLETALKIGLSANQHREKNCVKPYFSRDF